MGTVTNPEKGIEGGGCLVLSQNIVLTSRELVRNAGSVEVRMPYLETEVDGQIYYEHPKHDIALIKLEKKVETTPLRIGDAEIGQQVSTVFFSNGNATKINIKLNPENMDGQTFEAVRSTKSDAGYCVVNANTSKVVGLSIIEMQLSSQRVINYLYDGLGDVKIAIDSSVMVNSMKVLKNKKTNRYSLGCKIGQGKLSFPSSFVETEASEIIDNSSGAELEIIGEVKEEVMNAKINEPIDVPIYDDSQVISRPANYSVLRREGRHAEIELKSTNVIRINDEKLMLVDEFYPDMAGSCVISYSPYNLIGVITSESESGRPIVVSATSLQAE